MHVLTSIFSLILCMASIYIIFRQMLSDRKELDFYNNHDYVVYKEDHGNTSL